MPAPLLPRLREQYVDGNSEVYASAKLYFYLSGTTTPADTYSDSTLSTPNTNPVVASAEGLFGNIYLDPSKTYKAVLKTSADVTVFTVDPVSSQTGQLLSVLSKTGNYSVSVSDGDDVVIFVDATLGAVTISLYTAAGNGGRKVRVIKTDATANAVTLDASTTETINGGLTKILSAQYDAANIVSDGSNWVVLNAGALVQNVLSKTTTYSVVSADGDDVVVLADASGGAWTLSLYTAVGNKGRKVTVKKTDSSVNAITIDPSSTQTVDGVTTRDIARQNQVITLVSDGSNWKIEGQSEDEIDLTVSISSNVLTLDLRQSTMFKVSLNANITTLTINNPPPTGRVGFFTLRLVADGTLRTISFNGSRDKFAGGFTFTPTQTNNKVDLLTAFTPDGGTTYYWSVIGQNF